MKTDTTTVAALRHTAGPWEYSPAVACVFSNGKIPDAPQICSLPAFRPDNTANGHLIAAAPDLLAALRSIHALDLRHPDAGIMAANIAERTLARIAG